MFVCIWAQLQARETQTKIDVCFILEHLEELGFVVHLNGKPCLVNPAEAERVKF